MGRGEEVRHKGAVDARKDATWRERLRIAIDESGKTHGEIARKAGVTPTTLSRILSGNHATAYFNTVVQLVHVLGVRVGWLLQEPDCALSASEAKQLNDAVRTLDAIARKVSGGTRGGLVRMSANAVRTTQPIPARFSVLGARLAFIALGDSMIGAGIVDGDVLFAKPTREMPEGNARLVVCRIGTEEYIKELVIRKHEILLRNRNEHQPNTTIFEAEEIELVGVIVGRSERVLP